MDTRNRQNRRQQHRENRSAHVAATIGALIERHEDIFTTMTRISCSSYDIPRNNRTTDNLKEIITDRPVVVNIPGV